MGQLAVAVLESEHHWLMIGIVVAEGLHNWLGLYLEVVARRRRRAPGG